MGYKQFEFECHKCGLEWEELVNCIPPMDLCPNCDTNTKPCISIPKLATFSIMSPEEKTAHLKKRSADHTQKEIIEKTPEKWGQVGIDKARKGKIVSAGGLPKKKGKKK